MRISEWSSDVCSSDLIPRLGEVSDPHPRLGPRSRRGPHLVAVHHPAQPAASRSPGPAAVAQRRGARTLPQIGRPSRRYSSCTHVSNSVFAVHIKTTYHINITHTRTQTTKQHEQ